MIIIKPYENRIMGFALNLITEVTFLVAILHMFLIEFYYFDIYTQKNLCRYTIGVFYFMITFQLMAFYIHSFIAFARSILSRLAKRRNS